MAKVQNRALFIWLLVAACLVPPALADSRSSWFAQNFDNPDAVESPDAEPAPAEGAPPELAPAFEAPVDELPPDSSLTIEGSASMSVITRSLVQAFQAAYPDLTVNVVEQPAEVALQNVLAGSTKLAAIGRTLSDEQQAQGLTPVSVSREKIAVIVGADNPFEGQIEAEDFVRIFRGEITNWQDLGGSDLPIRFVDRPETSDTRASLSDYEIFAGDLSTGENVVRVPNDSTAEVVEALGDNGIGYAIASQVLDQENVRVIAMHDTLPDNPQYPYSQPRNYVYLNQAPLPPEVEAFLALATNPEGQEAVAEAKAAEAADVAVADLPNQVSAIRPDGQGFATGDREGNLKFWNADGTPAGEPVPAHTGPVTALAFGDNGQRLISGGADGTLRLWDAAGSPIGDPINSGNGPVTSLIVKPDGSFISATADGVVQPWDNVGSPTGEPIPAHEGTIRDIALSPDGATLVTTGEDGTIRRWNATDFTPQGEPLTGHQGAVQALSMQPDGSFFSGGADGTVRQWAADGTPIGEPLPVSGPVTAIATNPDGTSLAVGDETGALQYLSDEGIPVGAPLTDVGAPVDDLAFTPDGQQLIVSAGNAPQLRDSTGQIIPIPEAPAEVDEAPETSGLPPALEDLWGQLQGLPPQVLWIIPLALLALLLLGLLRSFRQEQDDLGEDEPEVDRLPSAVAPSENVDEFTADDFTADDFQPESMAGFTSDAAAGSLDPSLAVAKQTLSEGVSLGNDGRYQAALDRFNKAIELADMERLKAAAAGTTLVGAGAVIARGLARRGNALANLGRSDDALKSLNRSLEMDPNDAAAWIGKGNVLMTMGQLDEALFCFDKAIELNDNLGAAWQGKGKALQKMGRNAEARKCFDTAESLGGSREDIPLDLGTPLASGGEGTSTAEGTASGIAASPAASVTRPPGRLAIEPGPLPTTSSLPLVDEPSAPTDAPETLSSPADEPVPQAPIGTMGMKSSEPMPLPDSESELPSDLLAAISDLPSAESAASDTTAEPPLEASARSQVEPLEPLPDDLETDVPAEILQSIATLPAEPEAAAADAPLSAPVEVPPEVDAILAGDSDMPVPPETASDAAVSDPLANLFGDDPLMAMRSPTDPTWEEVPPSSSAESPAMDRPGAAIVPDQPEADDDALSGLPPEVLEALQGIPADSPDSFDLPPSSKTQQPPPPPPHNPRIRNEEAPDSNFEGNS